MKFFCKRSIKYKCNEILNELHISMTSCPFLNRFSNKLRHGCPWDFFRGAKATPPFPIPPFSFLSFIFPLPFLLLSPPRRAAHLNLARGFGEGCTFSLQQEPQTQNNLLNVLTNTRNFGETVPLTPPLQLLRGSVPVPLIAAHVFKQRRLNYL